ncbi:hypothetical protein HDK77DRAFT_436273 [Phyllosticta capitalensis]
MVSRVEVVGCVVFSVSYHVTCCLAKVYLHVLHLTLLLQFAAGCTQLVPCAEPLTLGSAHQQPRISATRTVEARD